MGLLDRPGYYKLAVELGKVHPGSVFVGYVDEFIDHVRFMHQGVAGASVHPDLRAVVTWCTDQQPGALPPKYTVQTLIPYLLNFSKLEYLNISHCGINDTGVTQLANNLGALGVKTLVLADNQYVTQAGRDAIKQSLSQVPHEVFVSWAKSDGTGTATFKDKSNKTYDMVIKSDGADAIIDFADNNTGISGVSAGDTCPPSVRDQIATCVGGGVGTVTATWTHCSSAGDVRAQLVCRGGAFLAGCASTVAAFATTQCARGEGLDSIVDDSYRGFDVNDSQVSGASVDNNVSGNIGDFDLGSL